MGIELREVMVYQSPPELGALYTEVEEMMKQMGKEQKVLIAREIEKERLEAKRRKERKEKLQREFAIGLIIICAVFCLMFMTMYVIGLRQERFPDLGNCLVPKGSYLYHKWTSTIWATCS